MQTTVEIEMHERFNNVLIFYKPIFFHSDEDKSLIASRNYF